MKNYFYSNVIAEQIRTLLDENLSEEVSKNITVGDFSVLPSPKNLNEYLPAIVISLAEMDNKCANETLNVMYTPYYFNIYYIYPYTFESNMNPEKRGRRNAEKVANVLMNFRTLDGFKIKKSEVEAGGLVIHSVLSNIKYESLEDEFFRRVEIPMHISSIEFCVGFRTYSE